MTTTWTSRELDDELRRRDIFPPWDRGLRAEYTTADKLRTELDATPVTSDWYEWRRWDLALAERQARRAPGREFFRIVHEEVLTAAA